MWASEEGRTDVVEVLIKHGADVNATTEVSHLHIRAPYLCCGVDLLHVIVLPQRKKLSSF